MDISDPSFKERRDRCSRILEEIAQTDGSTSFTILELCGSDLSSLRVWTSYLPNARVIGSPPRDLAHRADDAGFTLDVGDLGDVRYLTGLVERYDPDLVIDAAHLVWDQRQAALGSMVPLLKAGAVYVVDGLHAGFGDSDLVRYLQGIVPGFAGTRPAIDEVDEFQRLAPDIVESITFRDRLCIVTRNAKEARRFTIRTDVEAERVTDLDNGGDYVRVPARVEGLEAGRRTKFVSTWAMPVSAPTGRVTELTDAVIYGRGLVTTSRHDLLRASMINTYDHQARLGGLYRIVGTNLAAHHGEPPSSPAWDDRPCVLLKQRWDTNFGHWLIESFARMALVRQTHDLAACNYVVGSSSPAMARVYLDSLACAGIEAARVKPTEGVPLRIRRLIYPHPLTVQPWVKAPLVVRYLEEIRDKVLAATVGHHDQPERIFVHRPHSSRRKLLEQDELMVIARSMGFQVVSPAQLDFRQQVFAFSRARYVVGALGAELANLVFCPRGVALLGLSPRTMQDDFYYDIICHKQGRYLSLHGPEAGHGFGVKADFHVDVSAFRRMMDELLTAGSD
jgi:hypothetical protein